MNTTLSRRGLLLGAFTAGAAATVAALPAIAAAEPPDPVFALDVHKAAWARLCELGDDCTLAEEDAAGGAADAALDEIAATPPTTLAGMRAVIEYLVELEGHSDYLPTLLRSSLLRSPLLAA